jgi:hypothetical protein
MGTLSFAPGEAFQFDWSHEVVVIAGVTTTVKVAHMRLRRRQEPRAGAIACLELAARRAAAMRLAA